MAVMDLWGFQKRFSFKRNWSLLYLEERDSRET